MLAKIIQDGLRTHGSTIIDTKEIQHGTKVRLVEGAIINVYKSPEVLVQGKAIFDSPERLRSHLEYLLPARITVWTLI